jgi:hypothetical protein
LCRVAVKKLVDDLSERFSKRAYVDVAISSLGQVADIICLDCLYVPSSQAKVLETRIFT